MCFRLFWPPNPALRAVPQVAERLNALAERTLVAANAAEMISGRAAEVLATKGDYRGDTYVPLLGEGRVQYF